MVTLLIFQKERTNQIFHPYLSTLIPKVDSPTRMSEFRPISLSNYTNKIISKIVSIRLNRMLHRPILDNQSGFISGRLITKNVTLTQEIIHSIAQPNQGGNIVTKLDMAKV